MLRGTTTTTMRKRSSPSMSPAEYDTSTSSNKLDLQANSGWIIIVIFIILTICYYFFANSSQLPRRIRTGSLLQTSSQHYHLYNDNTEYIYQIPPGITPKKATGIIFFAHGCSHSANDWFYPSQECPHCLGLPEETKITRYFLRNNFIVIAISSQNRDSKCWHSAIDNEPVQSILQSLRDEYQLEHVPLFAFGASSGGSFVGELGKNEEFIQKTKLKAIIVQISAIKVQSYSELPNVLKVPVLFIPMVSDDRTLGMVNRELEVIEQQMIYDSLSTICAIDPVIIDEFFFYRRIGGNILTRSVSLKLFDALRDGGIIDYGGYLVQDPREANWRELITDAIGQDVLDAMYDNLNADESAISEEMNVAFGLHECSSECNAEMLTFIKSVISA